MVDIDGIRDYLGKEKENAWIELEPQEDTVYWACRTGNRLMLLFYSGSEAGLSEYRMDSILNKVERAWDFYQGKLVNGDQEHLIGIVSADPELFKAMEPESRDQIRQALELAGIFSTEFNDSEDVDRLENDPLTENEEEVYRRVVGDLKKENPS